VDLESSSVAFNSSDVDEGGVTGSVDINTTVHGFISYQILDDLVVVSEIIEHEC
jgi:hypothetical protein